MSDPATAPQENPLRIFVQETLPLPKFFASRDYELDGTEVVSIGEKVDVSNDVNRYLRSAAKSCFQGRVIETTLMQTLIMGPPVDVYIFCSNDGGPGWMEFVLMDNEGVIHADHICSDIVYALDDLYLNRPKVQDFLKTKFPQGYQVWILPVGCIPPKSVLDKVVEDNRR